MLFPLKAVTLSALDKRIGTYLSVAVEELLTLKKTIPYLKKLHQKQLKEERLILI